MTAWAATRPATIGGRPRRDARWARIPAGRGVLAARRVGDDVEQHVTSAADESAISPS
ncbi:hypothetical protein [Frankia sp. Cppng1_Ct_nod]|uniref:hypothetical protein n=1 Tax=Frankia sp. Cppng1_Ct_nod TaxID=2897162 RepID=UPI0013EF63F4|nr:hypothetical protein [Frankia sp. Cppng1_Ct_nod]